MKSRRQILGISQAQLAERVNTSTNYIAQIETKMRFPTPEMLERIAVALGIDPPALFTTEIRPVTEVEVLLKAHKEILNDFTKLVTCRMKQLGQETPQFPGPNEDAEHTIV
jgi:transcriptional regulator with XRE-family HTH domain